MIYYQQMLDQYNCFVDTEVGKYFHSQRNSEQSKMALNLEKYHIQFQYFYFHHLCNKGNDEQKLMVKKISLGF